MKTRRWDFISDLRAEFGVQRLCRVLGTSRSGYYKHLATEDTRAEHAAEEAAAVAEIRRYFHDRGETAPDRVSTAIGRVRVALQVLDAQTRQTITRLADNVGPTPEDSVDKLLLNDLEQTIFASIADLLGPLRSSPSARPFGLNAERWVHNHLYSRAASIYGGTSQIQRNIIAERLLGLPRG